MTPETFKKTVIFVVDDEPAIAETLVLILKTVGYDARKFTTSTEALEAIRDCPPDLLLSDVVLPSMTGIDLAIKMAEEKLPTKILLLSGQTATDDLMERAAQRGCCFEVLPKPIAPRELMVNIERILRSENE